MDGKTKDESVEEEVEEARENKEAEHNSRDAEDAMRSENLMQ